MFGFFRPKKIVEEVREETKKGFEAVKKDILSVGDWIKHLDSEKKDHKNEIDLLKKDLLSVKEDIEKIKNTLEVFVNLNTNSRLNRSFKTGEHLLNKQTPVFDVQTDVQTPNLNNFSVTERAILFLLLNTEMKLSYEDLAAMLNKEKSTIRGQINTIKSKSESLIEETIEKNGKKRVYIPEKIKEKLLKKQKVRLKHKEEGKEKSKKEN